MKETPGAVTAGGNPLTVSGETLKVGEKAPDFILRAGDMSTRTLKDYAGKIKLLSVVTRLDTGVCDVQTHRFNGGCRETWR